MSRENHPAGTRKLSDLLPEVPSFDFGREYLEAEARKEERELEFGEFIKTVDDYVLENASLLISKHRDYGPKNISASPGGPLNGLRVRIHDKLARINHLIDSGADPENESLRDSFIDLANYATIALLVLDGEWPSE
jgi:hypothetical protein